MAKAQGEKVNKSDLIRSILGSHPDFTAKQVVEKLQENNITATEGLVYAVKQKLKPAGAKKAAKGKRNSNDQGRGMTLTPSGSLMLTGDGIAEVKALARKVGGLAELQKIVVALNAD